MPNKERFIPKLEIDGGKGAALTNLKNLKITIQRASRKTEGTELPYVPASDTGPPADDCKVYLQLWEADTFEKKVTGEAANSSNEFLVEIPGFIKQTGSGAATYDFLVGGAPTLATGDTVGWLTLTLKDVNGKPYGESGFVVPIVGEAEDDLDLGVTIEETAGTKAHESKVWTHASLLHVCNLTHIIGAMLAEGGLTLNFWADMNTTEARADRAEWMKTRSPDMKDGDGKKLAKGDSSGKYIADIINDAEFEVQGKEFANRFHSLSLNAAGDLILGSTPFWTGHDQIVSAIQTIRDKVHADFLKGKGEAPRLRRLSFMCHGDKHGVWSARPEKWIGNKDCPALAKKLASHMLDDCLLTLYACLTGYGGGGDVTFGATPASGNSVGEGSFAQAMCQALKEAGISRAAVWGHTTAGHTTKNPNLRAFVASQGDVPLSADLCWMVQAPPATEKERHNAAYKFIVKAGNKGDQIMHLSILHPAADVHKCTGGSCTA